MSLLEDYDTANTVYWDSFVQGAIAHLEQPEKWKTLLLESMNQPEILLPEQISMLQKIAHDSDYFLAELNTPNTKLPVAHVLVCLYHNLGRDRANLQEILKDVTEKVHAPEQIVTTSYIRKCHAGTVIGLRQNPHAIQGIQESILEQEIGEKLFYSTNQTQEPWYPLLDLFREKHVLVLYSGAASMHTIPQQINKIYKLAWPRGMPKNLLELLNEFRASITDNLLHRDEVKKRKDELAILKPALASCSKEALAEIVSEINTGLCEQAEAYWQKIAILPAELWMYYKTLSEYQQLKASHATLVPVSIGKRVHKTVKEIETKQYTKTVLRFAKRLLVLEGKETFEQD